MLSTLLAPTAHLAPTTGGAATAYSDLGKGLLTVLAFIAIISVLLIVLTHLEPERAALPDRRPEPRTRLATPAPSMPGFAEPQPVPRTQTDPAGAPLP
jgi:hypothetical protein